MKIIQAYRCEYCKPGHGRPYASANSCKKHEGKCFDNPISRSCATCKHLHRVLNPIEGKPGYLEPAYRCLAKKPGDPLTTRCPSWRREVDRYE